MFKSQISKIVLSSIQFIAIAPFLPVVALAYFCAMIESDTEEDQLPGKVEKSQSPSHSFLMKNSQKVRDSFLVA